MELHSGDVVQLKSGGPMMTIQRIIGKDKGNIMLTTADEFLKTQGYSDGDVVCQWFDDNKLESGTFKVDNLNKKE